MNPLCRLGLLLTVAALTFGGLTLGLASALPQQQGSADLLSQADGQWDGPGEEQGGAAAGSAVAGLPDIFHRGLSALAIGAPEAQPDGRVGAGSVYVVPEQHSSAAVDLTALAGRGYRIDGADAGDELGFSLAALTLAGGHPGLAIGAAFASLGGRASSGAVYVIDLTRLHGDLDLGLTPLPHAVVAVLRGPLACAELGYALSAGGGWLEAGAPGEDPGGCPTTAASGPVGGNSGAVWALPLAALHGTIDLAQRGSRAALYEGAASGERFGAAVSALPAGRAGFLAGAPYASPAGRAGAGIAYVLSAPRSGAVNRMTAPPAGSETILGPVADDALGFSLTAISGFLRGEGGLLALGAPQASPVDGAQAGEVFLVPFRPRASATLDLASPAPGIERIDGADPGDEAGYALAAAGSVNGTAAPSLVIGAPFVNSQTGIDRIDNGAAYVLYGGATASIVDLDHLRSRGFVALGARNSDEAGTAVGAVANGDGDGRPAVLVGAPFAESQFGSTPTEGGAVYSLLGWGTPQLRYGAGRLVARVGHRLTLRAQVARTGTASFTVTPALPSGLRLDRRTGTISGTPARPAPDAFYTVTLSDLAGQAQATLELAVTR